MMRLAFYLSDRFEYLISTFHFNLKLYLNDANVAGDCLWILFYSLSSLQYVFDFIIMEWLFI